MTAMLCVVIDPNPSYRVWVRRGLEAAGHRVIDAPECAGAMAAMEMTPPEVMLVATHIPGQDPAKFVELVRAMPRFSGMKVVFMIDASATGLFDRMSRYRSYPKITRPTNAKQAATFVADLLTVVAT
jgi:DNA-binding response OmpR family regulator